MPPHGGNCLRRDPVLPFTLSNHGEVMVHLAEVVVGGHQPTPEHSHWLLGNQTLEATIQGIVTDSGRLEVSFLTPWQKIDAVNTFLIPRSCLILSRSVMPKNPLNRDDMAVKSMLKTGLTFLTEPPMTPCASAAGGGWGWECQCPQMSDLCDVVMVTQAFCLLTCPDK